MEHCGSWTNWLKEKSSFHIVQLNHFRPCATITDGYPKKNADKEFENGVLEMQKNKALFSTYTAELISFTG